MGRPERVRLRDEAESSGATWTGSPKGVFAERKHHKPLRKLSRVGFIGWFVTSDFRVEVIVCKFTRRSAVGGSDLLDLVGKDSC